MSAMHSWKQITESTSDVLKGLSLVIPLALAAYDHVLTFDEEIRHLWSRTPSPVGLLALFVRYFTIASRAADLAIFLLTPWMDHHVCQTLRNIQLVAMGSTLIIILTHIIMALRVCALYQGHKTIILCLGFAIFCEAVLMTVKLYYRFGKTPENGFRHTVIINCVFALEFNSRLTIVYWAFPLLIDTLTFWLTLRQCRRFYGRKRSPLIKCLMINGLVYYLTFGVIHALNLSLILAAPVVIKTIAAGFTQILCSIFISRLLFNLRSCVTQNPSDGLDGPTTQRTNGRFTSIYEFF